MKEAVNIGLGPIMVPRLPIHDSKSFEVFIEDMYSGIRESLEDDEDVNPAILLVTDSDICKKAIDAEELMEPVVAVMQHPGFTTDEQKIEFVAHGKLIRDIVGATNYAIVFQSWVVAVPMPQNLDTVKHIAVSTHPDRVEAVTCLMYHEAYGDGMVKMGYATLQRDSKEKLSSIIWSPIQKAGGIFYLGNIEKGTLVGSVQIDKELGLQ